MAVKLEGSIKRYIGLSADAKPAMGLNLDGVTLTATDLPPGSSFLETDTGRIYRWNGIEWTNHVPSDETAQYLQAIIAELQALRHDLLEALA